MTNLLQNFCISSYFIWNDCSKYIFNSFSEKGYSYSYYFEFFHRGETHINLPLSWLLIHFTVINMALCFVIRSFLLNLIMIKLQRNVGNYVIFHNFALCTLSTNLWPCLMFKYIVLVSAIVFFINNIYLGQNKFVI